MKKLILICLITATSTLYAQERAEVVFHNFPWGTSMTEFTAKMGNPARVDEVNGLRSLVYDNLIVSGYRAFMVVFFSKNGLEGGTYYLETFSYDELVKCYSDLQNELIELYGPTRIINTIHRERAPYMTAWSHLKTGYIHLLVDTRKNDPISLWYSSPALTSQLFGIEIR